jgi:hypothetical protein
VLSLPNKPLDNVAAPEYNDFVVIDKEIVMYTFDGRKFKTLRAAVAYAAKTGAKTFTIEPVVVLNKEPGYVAYLANGMKL